MDARLELREPPLEFRRARLRIDLREARAQRLRVVAAFFCFGHRDLAPQLALLAVHRLELLENVGEFPAFRSEPCGGSRGKKKRERSVAADHARNDTLPPMNAGESWHDELAAAFLYRRIAAHESDARRKRLFEGLTRDAEAQAAHWDKRMRALGSEPPPFRPGPHARFVGALIPIFGPACLTHVLTAMKVRGMSVYRGEGMRLPSKHDDIGEQHKSRDERPDAVSTGGSLRAAVFGVNDGLVSNASLILGVAGASPDASIVMLSGVAGLLAGAFSMAAGEYVSMRSQREMYEHQIALERAELAEYPEEEAEELALILAAHRMDEEEARACSRSAPARARSPTSSASCWA
jgi:VIT family protein